MSWKETSCARWSASDASRHGRLSIPGSAGLAGTAGQSVFPAAEREPVQSIGRLRLRLHRNDASAARWPVADRDSIDRSRSLRRGLAGTLLPGYFDFAGEMQTPLQTALPVQALRNTRCSRGLRVDEASAVFHFSSSPIVLGSTDGAVRPSCR
jgi:hypothetical protein